MSDTEDKYEECHKCGQIDYVGEGFVVIDDLLICDDCFNFYCGE